MHADELIGLLRARYTEPEYVLIPQVRNAAGFAASRTADAIALSTYPSRGIELHGFEVKVNRGDWLRELKQPEKAEAIAARCHRWWVVASDAKIVLKDEVPTGWGLLVGTGGKLVAAKNAPLLTPEPPTWSFVAAVFRGMNKYDATAQRVRAAENNVREEERVHYAKLHEQYAQRADRSLKDCESRFREFEESVRQFETASGVSVRRPWSSYAGRPGEVGALLREILALRDGALLPGVAALQRCSEELAGAQRRIAQALTEMDMLRRPEEIRSHG